ncbi:methyl-accepting chemotaxis protein [Paenibacillus sp. YYML68]|uniref:methyl-accepting chemotaxis protein n=1 Tax=Paenibacillus sp. YYML68 TaxID=2909250 RepID=UPI0024902762|nr:methyl-accepting chemotaxis protein [Paenibacillus sp. YYML68]
MKKQWSSLRSKLQQAGRAVQSRLEAGRNSKQDGTGAISLSTITKQLKSIRPDIVTKSVGVKLFLIFFSCIVLFVLTVGLLSYSKSKEVLQDKVAYASEQTIIQAGSKLDFVYGTFEEMTMQIMLNEQLGEAIAMLKTESRSGYNYLTYMRAVTQELNMYAFSNKAIKAIHLFNEDGQPIGSTTNSFSSDSIKDVEWYKKTVEGNGKALWHNTTGKWGGVSSISNKPTFAVARLLKDSNTNTPKGVVLMEIDIETLGKETAQISMGEGGQTVILSKEHTYNYTDELDKLGAASELDIDKEALSEDHGYVVTRNGDFAIVYYKSQVNGWYTVGIMPIKELVKDAGVIFNMTIVIAVVAMLIAVVIGYFVARMIGQPLVQLRNLMKEGEQGNLGVRMNVNTKDEIGQLGDSFNEMMEKITELVKRTSISAQEVLATASELSEASKKTAMSAKDIAIATEEIANGASSLAVEAERGNELTHNIGMQMQSVVEANVIMGTAAGDVQGSSKQGIEYMQVLIGKTNETEAMTRSMVEKVDNLKESTRSIRKILDVLGNMTKQTNILSLNATIEAARAGAAGKGFMVVADEIRKLADQSRQSIAVVGQITETIQREIDETVQVLSKAYPIFQEQITSVKEADSIFKQVDEQMSGFILRLTDVTESISHLEASQSILTEAMSNVSAVAEESSATSQEVASLSTEQLNVSSGLVKLSDSLEQLSNSLKESLSKFRV